jgi:predicted ATPase
MRLSAFKITNYKVIDDTDWRPVDENVTALVGKNESGKTAILRAIWKSRNVASEAFDKLTDYPRTRYAKERKGSQYVTSLTFRLSSDDSKELAMTFPFSPKELPKVVTLLTWYKGEEETGTRVEFEPAIEKVCKRSSTVARAAVTRANEALKSANATEDPALATAYAAALAAIKDKEELPLWDPTTAGALATYDATVASWIAADPARRTHAEQERKHLSEIVAEAKGGDPGAGARTWTLDNLPTFIYFDNYGQLETRIHLPTYLARSPKPDARTRTQTALFEWSNLDPKEILDLGRPKANDETDEHVQRRKDKRRALLHSASFGLTFKWVDWWPEKQHRLHFEADGDDLVLSVSDEFNEFPIPFEERSHGFQWFFSFYLVFLVESKKAHQDAILLLDEPGLHLHPTLQLKLIDLFDKVAEENQLVYTTHLPFLVDGKHLERVRTVHRDPEAPQKSVVSTDVRPSGDRDTLFPLQAALGYSIAQTLFLGKRSVIIEGITDYWLLKTLDTSLRVLGAGPCLDEETILIPAGGTKRMMPLASIMFGSSGLDGRQMLVLLDSDTEGLQAAKRFEKELFGNQARIVVLGSAIGLPEATIEDLIPREAYGAVAAGSRGTVTLDTEEQNAPTNVAAMEKLFHRNGWGEFGLNEKVTAALSLVELWSKDPHRIPKETVERAQLLFDAVNRRF